MLRSLLFSFYFALCFVPKYQDRTLSINPTATVSPPLLKTNRPKDRHSLYSSNTKRSFTVISTVALDPPGKTRGLDLVTPDARFVDSSNLFNTAGTSMLCM
mmetsp:Transcript_21494/g.45001  ORF Transcript_21494/g.45001 Transcript_21494/m.45001 type:complete len:101 (+) Transcript_21494:840-1142(+)